MSFTVYVPPRLHGVCIEETLTHNDKTETHTRLTRPYQGRLIVDMDAETFRALLRGPHGLDWLQENPEAMDSIGRGFVHGFPGEHRPPPLPKPAETAPVMVRLLAPEGITSYSHDGIEHQIGKDRTVTVMSDLADTLRSHGFEAA